MSDVLVQREAGIVTLTFNRVAKKNALLPAMYTTLAEELENAAKDDQVRVVLIQGSAEVFTAGNDLKDFLMNPPQIDAQGGLPPVFRFLHALADCPKPVVAAVAGVAVGVGTTMLLHCDLVYAGDNALFKLPFVSLGTCPEAGSSYLLPLLVGYQRAAEKLMLGETFGAEEARQMGMVNQVVAAAEVNAYAYQQALKLAAQPMVSIKLTKRLMKRGQAAILAEVMREEGLHFGELLGGPACQEAIMAFMQKRTPDFSKF